VNVCAAKRSVCSRDETTTATTITGATATAAAPKTVAYILGQSTYIDLYRAYIEHVCECVCVSV